MTTRHPSEATFSEIVQAGDYWVHPIHKGQTLRIVDLEGNQAADTLFYDAADPLNRYSACDTVQRQGSLYLSTGSILYSCRGEALLEIVADTCGRHDTLGGACSRESNTMRYCHSKEHMHACRDSFLSAIQQWDASMDKRDITCNINFFMNVPVTPEGKLTFADGISAADRYVELVALRDVVCVVSNCPQLNNPCNAYNPTPVQMLIWDAA
jgi:uncharacterized protein